MLWLICFAVLARCYATSPPEPPSEKSEAECPEWCRPTCKVPHPKDCEVHINCTYCGKFAVWDESVKKCVTIEECPYGIGCNGDPNASIIVHPPACPSTCGLPNELPCPKVASDVGCECNLGYILDTQDGKCIKVDNCLGGHPCGVNGTFSHCLLECSSKFCPVDDGFRTPCDPWEFKRECRKGCVCKHMYLWKSKADKTCILAQECPKIKCRRQNEEWDPCTPSCFSDSCHQLSDQPIMCTGPFDPECKPQCRCKTDYARDTCHSKCIPAKECPPRTSSLS